MRNNGDTNLLEETQDTLKSISKTLDDVQVVINMALMPTERFIALAAATNYEAGFGSQKINCTLKLVGKDFWLERAEYDGSEWWVVKSLPSIPTEISPKNTLKDWDDEEDDEEQVEEETEVASTITHSLRLKCSNEGYYENSI